MRQLPRNIRQSIVHIMPAEISDVNVNTLTRRDISCISKLNIWENCMPRLKQVSKKNAPDNVKKYYNLLFGDRDPVAEPGTATGTPGNWWSVFALVPYIFDHATSHFGMFGMFASESVSKMDGAIRELAITRAGYTAASQFVYSQHCKAARRNGLSDEKIEAIPFWQVSDVFDAKEKAVLAWADALILRQRARFRRIVLMPFTHICLTKTF